MKTLILLVKEDITTTKNGANYHVTTKDGTIINFTPEAMNELISDVSALKVGEAKPALGFETNELGKKILGIKD